jgi:hypothetical protein
MPTTLSSALRSEGNELWKRERPCSPRFPAPLLTKPELSRPYVLRHLDEVRRYCGISVIPLGKYAAALRQEGSAIGDASTNPASGEALASFEPPTDAELGARIALAAESFAAYKNTSFS